MKKYSKILKFLKKSWFWNRREIWIDYPAHLLTSEIYYYYVVSCAFYVSLLVTQFFDVKRKDFWQMFFHHLVTISLIIISYVTNFTRIGCLILLIHDSADYWLELAKLSFYAKKKILSHFAFAMFTLVWFLTRLVLFPSRY